MTKERMLELILLYNVKDELVSESAYLTFKGVKFNYDKFAERLSELEDEFVKPYLID